MTGTEPDVRAAYARAIAVGPGKKIRIEVPPDSRFYSQLYVRLWDCVIGKCVGRRTETITKPDLTVVNHVAALVVEVETTSIVEAMKRVAERERHEAIEGPKNMRVNKLAQRPSVSTNR